MAAIDKLPLIAATCSPVRVSSLVSFGLLPLVISWRTLFASFSAAARAMLS
jgi:hypothetical protein